MSSKIEQATLGGGCFWCTEAVFRQLKGIELCESGYSGGSDPNPNYDKVCGGKTGHAEVIRLHYDPEVISFRKILAVFFAIHDPTTLNRQGNDVGTQYRSVIFFTRPSNATQPWLLLKTWKNGKFPRQGGYRDFALAELFSGREIPPGILREQPDATLLRVCSGTQG